jgi:hypothetical protein
VAAVVTGSPPPVGSAAEEAARLFAAAEEWLRARTGTPLDATASFVAALRSTVAGAADGAAGPRRPDVQRIPVQETTDDQQGEGE